MKKGSVTLIAAGNVYYRVYHNDLPLSNTLICRVAMMKLFHGFREREFPREFVLHWSTHKPRDGIYHRAVFDEDDLLQVEGFNQPFELMERAENYFISQVCYSPFYFWVEVDV